MMDQLVERLPPSWGTGIDSPAVLFYLDPVKEVNRWMWPAEGLED